MNKLTVLKKTYRLLSLTLLWSAGAAYYGMLHPLQSGGDVLMLFAASLAILFATSYFRNSPVGVVMVFAFTGLMGYNLGPLLNYQLQAVHGSETVGIALFTTGAMFLGLSAYVQASKKDFSFLGGFLFIALIGLTIVGLIDVFSSIPGMTLARAYFSALLFSGYILCDTSDIVFGRQTSYVMATVELYLDILNLFIALLRIFRFFNSSD